MITSLIEVLELQTLVALPNLQYKLSHLTKYFGDVIQRNYDFITFISKFKKA